MNYSNIKCHFYNYDFDSFLETGTLCHKTKISSDITFYSNILIILPVFQFLN